MSSQDQGKYLQATQRDQVGRSEAGRDDACAKQKTKPKTEKKKKKKKAKLQDGVGKFEMTKKKDGKIKTKSSSCGVRN